MRVSVCMCGSFGQEFWIGWPPLRQGGVTRALPLRAAGAKTAKPAKNRAYSRNDVYTRITHNKGFLYFYTDEQKFLDKHRTAVGL